MDDDIAWPVKGLHASVHLDGLANGHLPLPYFFLMLTCIHNHIIMWTMDIIASYHHTIISSDHIIILSQLHLISPRIHCIAKIRNAYCHFLATSFDVLHSEWWQYWRWLMSFPIFSLRILCRKFSPDISPKILVSFDKNP